jgi:hypothetical protein
VIAVAVGDVDRRQVLAVGGNPVGEVMCLVGGQLRVDEDSVPLAGDERRRRRRPQPLLGTGSGSSLAVGARAVTYTSR